MSIIQQERAQKQPKVAACFWKNACALVNSWEFVEKLKKDDHMHALSSHDSLIEEVFQGDRCGLFYVSAFDEYWQCLQIQPLQWISGLSASHWPKVDQTGVLPLRSWLHPECSVFRSGWFTREWFDQLVLGEHFAFFDRCECLSTNLRELLRAEIVLEIK